MKNRNFSSIERSLMGLGININQIELMEKINIRLPIAKIKRRKFEKTLVFKSHECITDGDTVIFNKQEIEIYRNATYVIYYGYQNKRIEKIFVTEDAKITEIHSIINKLKLKK